MDIATTAPLDDHGRLLHDDDPAAQIALATVRLEAALAEAGRSVHDLAAVRVLTTDAVAAATVLDVATDRLAELGSTASVELVEVPVLDRPGQVVALEPVLHADQLPSTPSRETPIRTTTHKGHEMTSTTLPAPADTLRDLCGGAVHLPGDPGYDATRTPWNVAVDLRPAAVALPRTTQDVVDVVRAARAVGLRVAPQSTGHGAGTLAGTDLSDVVLVKLTGLTGVSVDPESRTARVVGGTLWQDVVAAAAPHGLTALHGSAGDVAVAGYALSGGLSFYGRRHGLAASSIRAVELVTAAGDLVRADAEHHADLFWAVRGGGGSFGIVVAIEIALLPIADVVAGMLLWDRERAPEVVRAWTRWTREVPDSVTTSLRVMSFPPLPELPPFLSGRQLVVVDGAVLEEDERAAELLAPLRALAPEMDTFARIPAPALLQVHMDPPAPTPSVAEHCVLGAIDDDTVEALLAEVGPGTRSPLMFAELRHLGGALSRPAEGAGVVSHLPGEYALLALAVAATPEMATEGLAAAQRLVAALAPWSVPGRVLTFTERPDDSSTGYPAEARQRVAALREAYDPEGALVAAHRP